MNGKGTDPLVRVGDSMLGRILDGLGAPLDRGGPLDCRAEYPLYGQRMNPLDRTPIREPLDLGIRAINALLTCGRGQRLAAATEPAESSEPTVPGDSQSNGADPERLGRRLGVPAEAVDQADHVAFSRGQ